LVACDHHPHNLEAIHRRHPEVKLETLFQRLLLDDSIEAVVLSTPIPTHVELGLAALEAGKHLFVEKPLATTVWAAERLVEAAARRGLVLHVGHSFEHSPPAVAMTERIRSGALGELYYATMRRVNLGRHQRDSSVLWDLAVHDVSLLLRWRAEEPSSVRLIGRSPLTDGPLEFAFLTLEFPSGFVANIEVSWLAPEKSRLVQAVGAKGTIEYRASETEEDLRLYDRGARVVEREAQYHRGEARIVDLTGPEAIDRELQFFLEALRSPSPGASEGDHAIRVVRVLETAERVLGSRPRGDCS
jgi:predicted dehydrogenase